MVAPIAVVLAQLAAGPWSSSRPPECAAAVGHATNVWERAKSPELGRYCDLVASASSKLAGSAATAQAALDAAHEADAVLPGHAAPLALQGRALAALGKIDDAHTALRDAAARDARALDDPPALLAWARVLARTGHADAAAKAYRALLPRAAGLGSNDRAAAATEAGLVAMSLGPSGLDDAAAAFREAMHGAQDEIEPVAALGLALALDRRGDSGEARALLSDRVRGDPRAFLATPRARELVAVAPGEGEALLALGLEASDPSGAREEWEKYAAEASPWAAHARAHQAALGSKAGARRKP
jgi:tetratricopeptide (TPR) repeat protein